MLKNNFLLLFIFMIFSNCVSQKQSSFKEINYNCITRGRFINIMIKDNQFSYKSSQKSKVITLTENQKKSLSQIISNINLDEMATLKAPSNKRAFDGAMHAVFIIKSKDKTYTSTTFDDTNPPLKLKVLTEKITSFITNE